MSSRPYRIGLFRVYALAGHLYWRVGLGLHVPSLHCGSKFTDLLPMAGKEHVYRQRWDANPVLAPLGESLSAISVSM